MMAWKESASLVLAARHAQLSTRNLPSACNYKLLCLRRSQTTKFMPGCYVFPGGTVDSADCDLKWNHLFSNFGFEAESFATLFPNTTKNRPIIFDPTPNGLPKEISLRITAIRETFEECGVLLCKQEKDRGKNAEWATNLQVSDEEREAWQKKVHADASQFYALCQEFQCYPDLWSLHEWGNWLTPTYLTRARFNTAFFIACMSTMPQAAHEVTEMDDLIWDTPKNLLRAEVSLPMPQYYEVSRLAKFESDEDLLKFAIERSKVGSELILPVMARMKDGMIHLLPGDSAYPQDVSLTDVQVLDMKTVTIDEFRAASSMKKRGEFRSPTLMRLVVENCEGAGDHLSKMELETIRGRLNNKL